MHTSCISEQSGTQLPQKEGFLGKEVEEVPDDEFINKKNFHTYTQTSPHMCICDITTLHCLIRCLSPSGIGEDFELIPFWNSERIQKSMICLNSPRR